MRNLSALIFNNLIIFNGLWVIESLSSLSSPRAGHAGPVCANGDS
jgi:hypothetical protein